MRIKIHSQTKIEFHKQNENLGKIFPKFHQNSRYLIMKKYFALLIFCCSTLFILGQKQVDDLFTKDTIKINKLIALHDAFKPDSAQIEKDTNYVKFIIDQIRFEINKGTLPKTKEKRQKKIANKFEVVYKDMGILIHKWEKAKLEIKNLMYLKNNIFNKISEGEISNINDYKSYKTKIGLDNSIKDYKKQFKSIRKLESKLYKKLGLIYWQLRPRLNVKKSAPFSEFTSYMHKYSHKPRLDVKSLTTEKKTLKNELLKLNQQKYATELFLKKSDEELKVKERLIEEKEKQLKNYAQLNDDLKQMIASLKSDSASMSNMNLDMKQFLQKNKTDLSKTQLKLRNANVDISEKVDSLNILGKQMNKIEGKIQDYTQQKDEYKKEIESLERQRENLTEANEEAQFRQYILFGILLASLFFFMKSINRKEAKAKAKIAKAFQELSDVKAVVDNKNEELKLSHKELNHRIKNNLQQISSLIYLQAEELEDENNKESFYDLQGRIDTIGIIHQKLYSSNQKKLTTVNIRDYVGDLVKFIVGNDAEYQLELEDINIEMDNAIHIGLILNELISNAQKYAFPNTANPQLGIKIKVENDFLNIGVKDNGPGFPEDFNLKTSNSFGLKSIVEMLVMYRSQKGEMNIINNNGTLVNIKLPFDYESYSLIA